MKHILITAIENTARSVLGTTLTGGVHYLLVPEKDAEVRAGIALGFLDVVPNFSTNEGLNRNDLRKMVEEVQLSRPQEEGQTYSEYRLNLYTYAIQALLSKEDDDAVPAAVDLKPTAAPATGRRNSNNKKSDEAKADDVSKAADENKGD